MAVLAGIALCTAAQAQDATWKPAPANNNFNNGGNWNPDQVPTGTATFNTSSITSLTFSAAATSINGWTFNPGASNYTFTLNSANTLTFTGDGIATNGGSATIIVNGGTGSPGGLATGGLFNTGFTNGTSIVLNSTGFLSGFTNGSSLIFNNNSTAGSATIVVNSGSLPINGGSLTFNNTSTAGSAAITNNSFTSFNNSSTAGNSSITNNGFVNFFDTSKAGAATITTNNGGFTTFFDNSDGGSARFITNAGGVFDISALTSAGMNAGSIEGAGNFFLGSKQLTVGGNNQNTTVSGVIGDCGASGTDCEGSSLGQPGTGGSLVKLGTGTLTLSGIIPTRVRQSSIPAPWKSTARSRRRT